MTQTKNHLKIQARSLDLELTGEAEYIDQAYEALYPVLMERFAESIRGHIDETNEIRPAQGRADQRTLPLTPVSEEGDPTKETEPLDERQHVNLVMCNEVYNKIHLIERDDLEETPFARAIDFRTVHRIFVNRDQQNRFREFFDFGKVLWRELTSAGKEAVKKSQHGK